MKMDHLLQLLKKGYFVVPLYLFEQREKLSLSMDEFVFLLYLVNQGEKFPFNPMKIKEDLNYELPKVMEFISALTEKKLLNVSVVKNEKGIMEEYVDLSLFYEKLGLFLADEINQHQESDSTNLFTKFEQEFGRTLSPMEYEIIKAWQDSGTSEELILRALKEATYYGALNLRYIDKILYEWNRKGFKTVDDVAKNEKMRREKKEKPKVETFDYNWFDEDDEDE